MLELLYGTLFLLLVLLYSYILVKVGASAYFHERFKYYSRVFDMISNQAERKGRSNG